MTMDGIPAWSLSYGLKVGVASRDTMGRSFDWPLLATRAVIAGNR